MPQDPQQSGIPPVEGFNMGAPQGTVRSFIQSLVNIHTGQQNQAASRLNQAMAAAQQGFPVDPKHVEKMAKKAGIPLMKPEDMKSLLNPPQGGDQPQGKGQQQQQGEDPHAAAYNVKAITDVKERQKAETNHQVDYMIRQAVTNAQLKGQNEQQLLDYTHQLMGLKQQALSGDAQALGRLAQAGEMKIDVPTQVWQAYSPEQKGKYLEMQRGAETDSQKAARVDNVASHLIDMGEFKNPESAFKAAKILADGGELPRELRSEMRPTSMGDLVQEVGIMGKLAEMGFSGDQISGMVRGANLTGMQNYFPKGMQTLQQQQMLIRNKELSVQRAQVGVEGMRAQTERMDVVGMDKKGPDGKITHTPGRLESYGMEADARKLSADNVAKRLDILGKKEENKSLIAQYTELVDIKRAGGKVDPDVLALYQSKLVDQLGGQVTLQEVNDFWHFVTGGTHMEMKMGMSPESAQKAGGMGKDDDVLSQQETDPAASAAGSPQ